MQMRRLGRHGPDISVIGYGAWQAGGDMWGPNPSDQQVIDAIRAGLDAGMNWIDTAEAYGRGHSEALVGRAVRGRPRDQVLVFTKVAPDLSGVRPTEVRKAIRASLQRLELDHVDLYQVHWPDPSVALEDTWGTMAELIDEGLTRHIGVSNFDREQVERCLAIRHVDAVQNEFSLLDQEDRADFLPWLEERGIGYLAYSPLAKGILTGTLSSDSRFEDFRSGSWGRVPRDFRDGVFERNVDRAQRLGKVAERLGVSAAALALGWVVHQRGVTGAIVGTRNPEHTRDNAAAGDLELDEETLAEIDEIFG